jgi:hypothetical protein
MNGDDKVFSGRKQAMMKLEKYSFGIGDRFGQQGKAQLSALIEARSLGHLIVPVWNKSFREHSIIGTGPNDIRKEADAAVQSSGWKDSYYVDADHISLKNVDGFIEASNFFTLDVADWIGKPAEAADIEKFIKDCKTCLGTVRIPGIEESFSITPQIVQTIAAKFLRAAQEAGAIYRHLVSRKGKNAFVTEVSTDESDTPQTPVELFFILKMLAAQGIPAQTIAPKFTGRFNKGVDYVGDVRQFEKEFRDDLAAIAFAIQQFGLPQNLKLSIHSGSDKFSIYPLIHKALKETGAGLHVKTAGTTWLEEVIGLAQAGGEGLDIAKDIYAQAYAHREELCAPYATVIDINPAKLPAPGDVKNWNETQYTGALRHDQKNPAYNPNFRQLIHVGYKMAAKMGDRYLDALVKFESVVAENVKTNLLARHIKPLFGGK